MIVPPYSNPTSLPLLGAKSSCSAAFDLAVGTGPCARRLRTPADLPRGGRTARPKTAGAPAELTAPCILCRDCLHPVTRPAERIGIDGSHRHTFANPHGIVFEIGCFRMAEGCARIGPRSDEFAWFAGYTWQVGVCAACLVHIGWHFAATGGGDFYGLILDRLIEKE
jgi:hypothetical protein